VLALLVYLQQQIVPLVQVVQVFHLQLREQQLLAQAVVVAQLILVELLVQEAQGEAVQEAMVLAQLLQQQILVLAVAVGLKQIVAALVVLAL
jgi:hypothetical protein